MITRMLVDVLMWFFEAALALVDQVVPSVFLTWLQAAIDGLEPMLSFGPISLVLVLMGFYFGTDTAINAFVFAINAYRLIPAKAT